MGEILGNLLIFLLMVVDIIAGSKSRKLILRRRDAKVKGIDLEEKEAWLWVFSFLTPVLLIGVVMWIWDYLSR